MKTITIILLGILFLSLFTIVFYFDNQDKVIQFGDLEIPSKQFKSITEQLPDGNFNLCSMKEENCIVLNKVSLEDRLNFK